MKTSHLKIILGFSLIFMVGILFVNPGSGFNFYEKNYDQDGIVVLFGNTSTRMSFVINTTAAGIPIQKVILNGYTFTSSIEETNYAANFTSNPYIVEVAIIRDESTADNTIELSINDGSMITLHVRPRTNTGAYEISGNFAAWAQSVWNLFFTAGPISGIIWASFVIALWRIAQRPWFMVSKSAGDRRSILLGKLVDCEKSERLNGVYVYRFKYGAKIIEYFCKENYETLKTQVAFDKFMIYWEFYPDLIPVNLTLPEEIRWNKTEIGKGKKFVKNYLLYALKYLTCMIPSTHLAKWIDNAIIRVDTREKIESIPYLVVDFVEDRITTVYDVSYDESILDPSQKKIVWKSIEKPGAHFSQIEDLKRHLVDDKSEPSMNAIRKLKISEPKQILEQYSTLRDANKDRASRLQIKAIADAKMLLYDFKLEQMTKLYLETESKYNQQTLNFNVELRKQMQTVRKELDFNRQKLPEIVAEIFGKTQTGVGYQKAIEDALSKHLNTFNDTERAFFKTQLDIKEKALTEAQRRIQHLEEKILQKNANDLTINDLKILEGPSNGITV